MGHLSPMVDSSQTFASHYLHCPPWLPLPCLSSGALAGDRRPVLQESPCYSHTCSLATLAVLTNMAPGQSWQEGAPPTPAGQQPTSASLCCLGAWDGHGVLLLPPRHGPRPSPPRADGDQDLGDTQCNMHAGRHTHAHPILTQDASLAWQTTPCISPWPVPRDLLALS